ncbi:MAG: UDP-N-acetylmuramate dehydrogenase [Verrucomicrobia bacterium]|nr:UDP-N-acetylmuramate dehydrogenase [Verrucomicrobiota bacterium]
MSGHNENPVAGLSSDRLDATHEFLRELEKAASGEARIRCGELLAKRTTLRVGGPAEFFVEPRSEAALAGVVHLCRQEGKPVFVLGRGSNLLIRDGGIPGVVLSLGDGCFSKIEPWEKGLRVGAGARLKDVAHAARRLGWAGLEFLEGIPGSVGGALRMNAGAMGSEIFDRVERVRSMDREGMIRERVRGEIKARYRGCALLEEEIALGAWFCGEPAEEPRIREAMERFNRKRWETQPPQPSAGCIFRNPEGTPAGRLVDELGLKGSREGGARVSEVHGNFIVNEGGATASDVLKLIERIQRVVRDSRGIDLRTEVEIVGVDRAGAPSGGGRT